jgi:small subunit ribosomal protein S21
MGIVLASVEVKNGDIGKALKLFKKKVDQSNHIQELKDRKYYKKPSVVKREEKNKLLYRLQKERKLEQEREKGIIPRKTK